MFYNCQTGRLGIVGFVDGASLRRELRLGRLGPLCCLGVALALMLHAFRNLWELWQVCARPRRKPIVPGSVRFSTPRNLVLQAG